MWYLKLALARSRVLIEVGRGRTLSWKRLPRPLVFFFFIIIFDVFKLIYIHVYITDYTRELLLFFRCLSTSCNIASRGFTPSYTALVILLKLYPLVVLSMYDVYVLHVCILFCACLKWYLKLALAKSRVLKEVGSGSSLPWKRLQRLLVVFFLHDCFWFVYIDIFTCMHYWLH